MMLLLILVHWTGYGEVNQRHCRINSCAVAEVNKYKIYIPVPYPCYAIYCYETNDRMVLKTRLVFRSG